MGQKESILGYLQAGNTLTGLEALRLFQTMKLSTRISELKRDGHDIMSQLVMINNKWVSKYFIIQGDK